MSLVAKYRALAGHIADCGLAWVEDHGTARLGEASLTAMQQAAHAGKAAMDAAAAAEIKPGDVAQILDRLEEELEAAELTEHAIISSPEDLLRVVLGELVALRRHNTAVQPKLEALADGYKIVAGRLLRITEQAEATGQEGSIRVARQNRAAIDEAVLTLQAADLEVPIKARSAT